MEYPYTKPKFGYTFNKDLNENTCEVKKIVELIVDENLEDEISIESVNLFSKIEVLKSNGYKNDLAKVLKTGVQDFQYVIRSSKEIDFYRVKRKKKDFDLLELVNFVERNVILS